MIKATAQQLVRGMRRAFKPRRDGRLGRSSTGAGEGPGAGRDDQRNIPGKKVETGFVRTDNMRN